MHLSREDDGFTLVELIIAILIIGVITVPLGNVVIGFLKNSDATTARLLESDDAQITSAYWAQDVASIGTRSADYTFKQSVETAPTVVPYDSGLYPCGAAATPDAIVRLAWDDFTRDGLLTVVRVAYVVTQTAAGPTELHRLRCEGSATPVSDVILAHDLDPDPLKPPTVTCSTTCNAPAVPASVTIKLNLRDPNNHGSAYVIELTGQRRQSL